MNSIKLPEKAAKYLVELQEAAVRAQQAYNLAMTGALLGAGVDLPEGDRIQVSVGKDGTVTFEEPHATQ